MEYSEEGEGKYTFSTVRGILDKVDLLVNTNYLKRRRKKRVGFLVCQNLYKRDTKYSELRDTYETQYHIFWLKQLQVLWGKETQKRSGSRRCKARV